MPEVGEAAGAEAMAAPAEVPMPELGEAAGAEAMAASAEVPRPELGEAAGAEAPAGQPDAEMQVERPEGPAEEASAARPEAELPDAEMQEAEQHAEQEAPVKEERPHHDEAPVKEEPPSTAAGAAEAEGREEAPAATAAAADPEPAAAPGSQAMVEEDPVPPSAQTDSGSFVHLLLADADASHEPQVFRMRTSQPLQRLLITYMDFRKLAAADAPSLRLSALGQEQLDPSVTASAIGLADGDCVTVHVPPAAAKAAAAAAAAEPKAKAAKAAGAGRGRRRRNTAKAAPAATQPSQKQRRGRGRPARAARAAPEAPEEEAAPEEEYLKEPKRPTSSYFLWYVENREAVSTAVGKGVTTGALARIAADHWKALSPEERAPYEAKAAERKAEYQQALADFVARGGVPRRRARKDQADPVPRLPKRPCGGAYGEYLRSHRAEVRALLPADAQVYDVTRECARRWKQLPEEAREEYQERFQARLDEYNDTYKDAIPVTGVARSATVTQGPAKGWKVQAWMNSGKAVQWRIFEPRKSGRAFRTFNNFKALRGNVDKKVYRQLSQMVKPGLVRRLSARAPRGGRKEAVAQPLEDETPSKRRRRGQGEDGALVKAAPAGGRHGQAGADLETPDRLERPLMATQAYFPPEERRPRGKAWTCSCEAHLVRHQRCTASEGSHQPKVIHLRDTAVTIGRAESNDVVLNSTRTPQMLSRCHAKLFSEGGSCGSAYSLTDQGSTNGILLNGKSLQGTCQLNNGDVVTFGVQTAHPEFDYIFESRAGASF